MLKGKAGISVAHPGIQAAYFVFCHPHRMASCLLLLFPCILGALWRRYVSTNGCWGRSVLRGRCMLLSAAATVTSSRGAAATWVENVLCLVEVSHATRCCPVQRPRSLSEVGVLHGDGNKCHIQVVFSVHGFGPVCSSSVFIISLPDPSFASSNIVPTVFFFFFFPRLPLPA